MFHFTKFTLSDSIYSIECTHIRIECIQRSRQIYGRSKFGQSDKEKNRAPSNQIDRLSEWKIIWIVYSKGRVLKVLVYRFVGMKSFLPRSLAHFIVLYSHLQFLLLANCWDVLNKYILLTLDIFLLKFVRVHPVEIHIFACDILARI